MISGQNQSVAENSTAIQAKGDVTVNQGITISQMGEIMLQLHKLVNEYTAQAASTADERFQKFQSAMLEKFADSSRANPDAFKDPDFQFTLGNAQKNCARDGNENTSELLVELLAARSLQPERNRMALILNQATETITKLTNEDLAVLTVAFALFYVSFGSYTYDQLIAKLNKCVSPNITELKNSSSCAYLEALGCASINHMIKRDIVDILRRQYSQSFSDAFSFDEIKKVSANPVITKSLFSMLYSDKEMFRFVITSNEAIIVKFREVGASDDEANLLQGLLNSRIWNVDAINEKLTNDFVSFPYLKSIWDSSEIKSLTLTSVGIAIAHSNLMRTNSIAAPLDLWIK